MIRILTITALLLLVTPAWAQQAVPLTGAGGKFKAASAAAYVGPGDVVGSASGFWSCSRAYTAAYAAGAGNACDIVDVSTGTVSCTMKFATNGFPDLTSSLCTGGTLTVPAFCTAHTSCLVSKAYDQVGTSVCTTACDAVQATNGNRPALTFNCIGTIPCMTDDNTAAAKFLETANWTSPTQIAQPCSEFIATQRSSGTVQSQIIVSSNTTTGMYFSGTAQEVLVFAGGGTPSVSAATGSFHAVQVAFNGASSLLAGDGSAPATVSPGVGDCVNTNGLIIGSSSQLSQVELILEAGLYPIALNSTQIGQINSNQHTEYGF